MCGIILKDPSYKHTCEDEARREVGVCAQTEASTEAPVARLIFDRVDKLRFGLLPRKVTFDSLNSFRKLKHKSHQYSHLGHTV